MHTLLCGPSLVLASSSSCTYLLASCAKNNKRGVFLVIPESKCWQWMCNLLVSGWLDVMRSSGRRSNNFWFLCFVIILFFPSPFPFIVLSPKPCMVDRNRGGNSFDEPCFSLSGWELSIYLSGHQISQRCLSLRVATVFCFRYLSCIAKSRRIVPIRIISEHVAILCGYHLANKCHTHAELSWIFEIPACESAQQRHSGYSWISPSCSKSKVTLASHLKSARVWSIVQGDWPILARDTSKQPFDG